MNFVCKDDDGDWYYLDGMYKRFLGDELRAAIRGHSLPNPHILLQKRKLLYPKAKEKDISPTEATFKLWEHWNAHQ